MKQSKIKPQEQARNTSVPNTKPLGREEVELCEELALLLRALGYQFVSAALLANSVFGSGSLRPVGDKLKSGKYPELPPHSFGRSRPGESIWIQRQLDCSLCSKINAPL